MVTLGWTLDKPLALLFDPFESIVSYVYVERPLAGLSSLSGTLHLWQVISVTWRAVLKWHFSSNNELRRCRREV